MLARAEETVWGPTSLALCLGCCSRCWPLAVSGVRYVPGRTVNQIADAYRGEAKTDAKDACVSVETLRHRGGLTPVEVATSSVSELRLLVVHRTDLVGDRVRMVTASVTSSAATSLPCSGFRLHPRPWWAGPVDRLRTPAAIRRAGESRLRAWLVKRKVRGAEQLPADALSTAQTKYTVVTGQDVAARHRGRPRHPAPGHRDRDR